MLRYHIFFHSNFDVNLWKNAWSTLLNALRLVEKRCREPLSGAKSYWSIQQGLTSLAFILTRTILLHSRLSEEFSRKETPFHLGYKRIRDSSTFTSQALHRTRLHNLTSLWMLSVRNNSELNCRTALSFVSILFNSEPRN